MNSKETNKDMMKYYGKYLSLLTLLLFAITSLWFYNSLKCTLVFITNVYQEPVKVLSMIISYLTPTICFGFFFYDSYVKPINKIVKIVYVCVVSVFAIFGLTGVLTNLSLHISNSDLGVYDSLPSLGISCPYDIIISNIVIIIFQAYNIMILIKPGHKLASIKQAFVNYGFFRYKKFAFIGVVVTALISMFYIGAFFSGIEAIDNVTYDPKYLFLMALIIVIPLMNFIYFLVNPSIRSIEHKTKVTLYSAAIGVNAVFGILMLIFTLVYPNYIAIIGKPLFPVDYTISIPVGPYSIAILIVVCIILHSIKLAKILKENKKNLE